MKRLLFLTLTVLIASSGIAQETASNFNQAKLHLANHKLDRAIPILEGTMGKGPVERQPQLLVGLVLRKRRPPD